MHKLVFHRNRHFEEGDRSIKHICKKENEKLNCRTLIKTNIQREYKYRDERGKKYSNIETSTNKRPGRQ